MPLEAASFISGLVSSNPPTDDEIQQGDDHLRLLKAVLQATFPNASKAFYLPDSANKTGNYTLLISDQNKIFTADATGGAFVFTLPTVGLTAGYSAIITKIDASANAVALTPSSGTISGAASLSLASQWAGAIVMWTGSDWIGLRFLTSTITGNIIFADEVTFNDVVTFVQGVEFQGPLDIQGDVETSGELLISGQLKLTPQTLTDGAAVAWPMADAPYAKWTAAGDRTVSAPTGEEEGQLHFLKYVQDATGNRVPTWNAAYKGPGGAVEAPDLAANAETLYLAFVRGADDVILKRLWGSANGAMSYRDYNMGEAESFTSDRAVVTHGLGHVPSQVLVFFKNTSPNAGYAVGDYVLVADGVTTGSDNAHGSNIGMNATEAWFTFGSGLDFRDKTTGASTSIDEEDWDIIIRVFH